MLIHAKNINVTRQKHHILEDISIQIKENSFTAIIGPNGAGKSTLLKCLIGLEKSQSGHIERKKNLKIGYVPQERQKNNSMPITVHRFLRLNKKCDAISLQKAIQQTNIDTILQKQLIHLSGGEMQRTLIARSLLDSPDILILDEPAQNLDSQGQIKFYELLSTLHKERKISILLVSHDVQLTFTFAKDIICLAQSTCCCGIPKDIIKHPTFTEIFGTEIGHTIAPSLQ